MFKIFKSIFKYTIKKKKKNKKNSSLFITIPTRCLLGNLVYIDPVS
jgi:hypothetical protein